MSALISLLLPSVMLPWKGGLAYLDKNKPSCKKSEIGVFFHLNNAKCRWSKCRGSCSVGFMVDNSINWTAPLKSLETFFFLLYPFSLCSASENFCVDTENYI